MKKTLVVTVAMLSVSMFATPGFSDMKKGEMIDGKREFKEHCLACHPDGKNIVNPKKPIGKASLASRGIKTEKDIIAKMRNPGPGMTKFDAKAVPDVEAKAIAAYILKTYK